MTDLIDFRPDPAAYRHWRLEIDGPVAQLFMDVDAAGGLFDGYELKLNSYDLGVDIELADIVQRLRFEQPAVRVVVLRSGKDRVFCAGANIRMLAGATHAHKVNFCKFTNETRNSLEAAGRDSGQTYIAAVRGACAGGGYELALACDHIILADDAVSSVALPEVPLLAVLPGTGGLTRITDKRGVRRDLADLFCTLEEGVRGAKAKDWRLVDDVVPASAFEATIAARAADLAAGSRRPDAATDAATGIALPRLERTLAADGTLRYGLVTVTIDRAARRATIALSGPADAAPASIDAVQAQGSDGYLLRLARELDDALLHLRLNEGSIGLLVVTTQGDPARVLAHEHQLLDQADHWLANEILQLWKRVLKRLDLTARSLVALVEHGSCFAGVLAELLFAVDRSYMMAGAFDGDSRPTATITLSAGNFGRYPMANGLTRLQTRFLGTPAQVDSLVARQGLALDAAAAAGLGLITIACDDIDWDDELRIFLEERASFSPDALSAMEANLRFAGPETMETRIFGRLTAWQNWVFQRPNAVGPEGALQRYGTGTRGAFDRSRV